MREGDIGIVLVGMALIPVIVLLVIEAIGLFIYWKKSKWLGIVICASPFAVFAATTASPLYAIHKACAADGGFRQFEQVHQLESVIYINNTAKEWARGCNSHCSSMLAIPGMKFVEMTIGSKAAQSMGVASGLYRFESRDTRPPGERCFDLGARDCVIGIPIDSFQSRYVLLDGYEISATVRASAARAQASAEWSFDQTLLDPSVEVPDRISFGRYILLDRETDSLAAQMTAYWLRVDFLERVFVRLLEPVISPLLGCGRSALRWWEGDFNPSGFITHVLAATNKSTFN